MSGVPRKVIWPGSEVPNRAAPPLPGSAGPEGLTEATSNVNLVSAAACPSTLDVNSPMASIDIVIPATAGVSIFPRLSLSINGVSFWRLDGRPCTNVQAQAPPTIGSCVNKPQHRRVGTDDPPSRKPASCGKRSVGERCLVVAAPAQVRRGAHARRTGSHTWIKRRRRAAIGMRRERGILLLQMATLPAGGAQHLVDAGPAHQLLKLVPAVLTQVFEDRHTFTVQELPRFYQSRPGPRNRTPRNRSPGWKTRAIRGLCWWRSRTG